jgi:hypothetical protein
MNQNSIFKTLQEAWASRPQHCIPEGGTPTLLELLSSGFFAATRRASRITIQDPIMNFIEPGIEDMGLGHQLTRLGSIADTNPVI